MEPGFIMIRGGGLIIIPDPGHGVLISDTIPGMAGALVLDTILDGSIQDGVIIGDIGMVAGGDQVYIIPLIVADGMEAQDHIVFMEGMYLSTGTVM